MAHRSNKIDINNIKIYGPVPRTWITLVTVLMVTTAFGAIGWQQLQVSRALSSQSTQTTLVYDPTTQHYVETKSTTTSAPSNSSNTRIRFIWLGSAIAGTIVLIMLLHLWSKA